MSVKIHSLGTCYNSMIALAHWGEIQYEMKETCHCPVYEMRKIAQLSKVGFWLRSKSSAVGIHKSVFDY